jgi:twinkle protein
MTGSDPKADVMRWLSEARKLDADLLGAMRVRAVDHPHLGPVAAFPYVRPGEAEPHAYKFRGVDKRFASSKGQSRGMFNAPDLFRLQSLPIVITEGEIDCLSVMQAGFERAVSIPDGWTENKAHDEALAGVEPHLRDSPFVIVAGDNDEAGAGLPRYVANLLKGHDVRRAVWPDGCKDANDVLMLHGEGELARCLNAAVRLDPPGGLITGFSDMPPLSPRRVLRCGEKPFDWAVAFELGAVSVWTGVPGSGKSTFLTWATDRVSRYEKVRIGLMMFETHPHLLRDQLARCSYGRAFEALNEVNRERLVQDLDQRFRVVHARPDGDVAQTMGWLEQMIFTLALRDGCQVIVIDPWNELEHLPQPTETMTSYINWALKTIRQWAEQLNVHIALVAHPRKMPTDTVDRAPTGYDIAESAAFYNKPSLGVTVHQKRKEREDGTEDRWVQIVVWKVRDTLLYGFEKGRFDLTFDRDRATYVDRQRA